ncbi:hypothetical protein CTI12_AA620080 [Artemisia annua]|uniref:Alcohol dehydrogenase superfamily, zinc-type n=1 Tax=Artemisia annua TaxID=35608 RepID=A0A2U1KC79_ARTAN|nr:hypothetical protein CTI12_AA620080 [Artemisia annua]
MVLFMDFGFLVVCCCYDHNSNFVSRLMINGNGLGRVVSSDHPNYHKNDIVDLLKWKLGFDDAFNNKEEKDPNSAVQRVAVCGVISDYTKSGKRASPSMIDVIYERIMIQGFLVSDFYTNDFKDFMPTTIDYVRAGKLCVLEDISYGIDNIPCAFIGLFQGENVGKKIVKITE